MEVKETEKKERVVTPPADAFTPVESADSEAPRRNKAMLAALAIAAAAFIILVIIGIVALVNHGRPSPAPASSQGLPQPPPQNLTPGS